MQITKKRTDPRREPVAEVRYTAVFALYPGSIGASPPLPRTTRHSHNVSVAQHFGHTKCDQRTPSIQLNKMAWFTGFPAIAAKPTSGKQGDLCRREPKSTTDIRLARTQTSAVSKHAHDTGHYPIWNEVKFFDRDPHWHTRRVKEAIHIRLQPNNINRDTGIEIPEAWMPTIKKHNSRRTVQQQTAEVTATRRNNGTMEDRNALIIADLCDINGSM